MQNVKNKLQASDSHWFLFLLLPFFALIAAIRSYKSPWAPNIVWAFVVFYGFTFAISKEGGDADIMRYLQDLKEFYGKPLTLADIVTSFNDSGEADFLRLFLAVLISRFTDSGQVLTAVYGFIFGFFFTRNIWYIIKRLEGRIKWAPIVFLFIFFLINPFWNINGFRFNTAALMFVYGVLPYLYENKKSKLLISLLSILVHFSFLFPVAILGLYLIFGNRKNVYFGLFIISIFISSINIQSFNTFVESNVPQLFIDRSKAYRDEDRVDEFRQVQEGTMKSDQDLVTKNWYAGFYSEAFYWALKVLMIALFFFARRIFSANKWLLNGYCFGLLFFTFANLMQSVPSGERFLMISSLICVSLITFYLQNQPHERKITTLTTLLLPLLVLYMVVNLRTGLYTISVNTILSNPVMAMFTNYNLSLNDLIK